MILADMGIDQHADRGAQRTNFVQRADRTKHEVANAAGFDNDPAITDGIYRGLIDDVVVEESRRSMGIGSELMQRLLEWLTEMGLAQILLRCREDMVPFYKRHGFKIAHSVTMNLSQS